MSKTYDLYLINSVGSYSFDADYVRYILSRKAGKPVNVLIDSLGGSLAAALSISAAFRDHGDVHVHFTGMSASAATIASLGAKEITMASDAWYLIHKASIEIYEWASLNADQIEEKCRELEKKKAELARFDLAIAGYYAKRCKKDPKDLHDLMSKETFISAKEALEWGFVDSIEDIEGDEKAEITEKIAADLTARGIKIPDALRRQSPFARLLDKITNIISPSPSMDTKNTPENEKQTPENGKQTPENEKQKPESGKQKPENGKQKPENGKSLEDRVADLESAYAEMKSRDRKPSDTNGQQTTEPENQVVNKGSAPAHSDFAASMKSAADFFNALP